MRHASRRTRAGLAASAVACLALSITVLYGNREIGFGETISEIQQRFALFIAVAVFAVQLLFFIKESREKR
jgi:hypothetical protein